MKIFSLVSVDSVLFVRFLLMLKLTNNNCLDADRLPSAAKIKVKSGVSWSIEHERQILGVGELEVALTEMMRLKDVGLEVQVDVNSRFLGIPVKTTLIYNATKLHITNPSHLPALHLLLSSPTPTKHSTSPLQSLRILALHSLPIRQLLHAPTARLHENISFCRRRFYQEMVSREGNGEIFQWRRRAAGLLDVGVEGVVPGVVARQVERLVRVSRLQLLHIYDKHGVPKSAQHIQMLLDVTNPPRFQTPQPDTTLDQQSYKQIVARNQLSPSTFEDDLCDQQAEILTAEGMRALLGYADADDLEERRIFAATFEGGKEVGLPGEGGGKLPGCLQEIYAACRGKVKAEKVKKNRQVEGWPRELLLSCFDC